MISKRKLFGAAAFSLALAGGGVAGAMLGTPGTSGAQDGTTTTTVASANRHPAVRRAVREVRRARGDALKTAADTLGMTPAELRTELQSGKSIADVAKEKNVDVQKVVDALVAEAKSRLETEIGKLPDQMTKVVNRKGIPAHPDGPPPPADGAPSTG
jgi:hypothetical protein